MSESSARRQLRATIATAVPTTTVRLAAIAVAVWVTTPCMLPMSLTRRDWTSPPRVRVKKRERLALQVGEEVAAQAVHDALADRGRQPGLHDADHGARDGDAEHRAHAQQQEAHVLLGERDVDDVADEEGLGQADGRAHDDQADDDGQGAPVGCEEARDAPQGDGGVRELPPVGGVGTAAAGAAGTGVVIHATSSSLGESNSGEVTSL